MTNIGQHLCDREQFLLISQVAAARVLGFLRAQESDLAATS